MTLPRHYPDEETFMQVEIVSDTIVKASESAFWSSLVMAILISISLKVIWNIMNVMQVLAYTRLFSLWPANIKTLMDSVHMAITMDVFYDKLINYGLDQYEIAAHRWSYEELRREGVNDPRLYRNLGIFALALIIILFLAFVYLLLKLVYKLYPKIAELKEIIG